MSSAWYFALGAGTGFAWTTVLLRWRVWLPKRRPMFGTVTINNPAGLKIYAIKEIRVWTGFGLREAKEASEGTPIVLPEEKAHGLVAGLSQLGVKFTVEWSRRPAA